MNLHIQYTPGPTGVVTIDILGVPKPGGSKTAQALYSRDGKPRLNNKGRVMTFTRDDAKGNQEWKGLVAFFARQQYQGEPLACALRVETTFYMPRPGGHYSKATGKLLPSAPAFPMVKPDATKLWRSTEDALTGLIWRDDNRIVSQTQHKRYADGRPPGAVVTVEVMGVTSPTRIKE